MKKKSLLALLLAASMAASTGCSSSATSSESSTTTTETTSSEGETTELQQVTLQLKWLPSVQFMGFYTAASLGYYEEAGIDIEIIAGGPDIVSANQVAIGAADVGVTNLYNLLPFQEQGYPITAIGQVFQEGSLILVAKASSGIESPEDFYGATIGAWLGTADYPIYALFDKYGIDKNTDVTLANQGATMDSFLSGDLDVASATVYNEYLLLLESGLAEEEINIISFDDEGCGMLEDTIIGNSEWITENPELAASFMAATMRGWATACADPEAAAEIVWEYIDQSSTTLEHQVAAAEAIAGVVAPNGTDIELMCAFNDEIIDSTAQIALTYEIISEIPENIYDATPWNTAYASLTE